MLLRTESHERHHDRHPVYGKLTRDRQED
jgi:hypothetical protein